MLFLGPSETIGSFTELFEPLDKRWKIFRRKESATALRALPAIPAQPAARDEGDATPAAFAPAIKETQTSTQIERLLLARFAPASVVVNDRGDIIYIHGRTGRYLEPTQGQPRTNILEMAREGLQVELASAMRQCVAGRTEVVREDVRVKTNGEFIHITLTVAELAGVWPASDEKPKSVELGHNPEALLLKLRYFGLNHTAVLYSAGIAAASRRLSLAMPPGVFSRWARYFNSRPSHSWRKAWLKPWSR